MNEPKNEAAASLARLGRGVPKRLSDAERERRRAAMVALNKARAAKAQGGAQ